MQIAQAVHEILW